jgi:hypothetical protein
MMRKGQWTLLPASLAHKLKGLHISPIRVVTQYDSRYRTIVDYSFYNVNDDIVPVAPNESMQFGRSLHRILLVILEENMRFGKVYMCKIDIANGFYRVWILPAYIPKLGAVFSTEDGAAHLISFPLWLQMGWVNSPPYFTAATKTICDLANAGLKDQPVFFVPHTLDVIS